MDDLTADSDRPKSEHPTELQEQAYRISHDIRNTLTEVWANITLAQIYMDQDTQKCNEKLIEAGEAINSMRDVLSELDSLLEAAGIDITEPYDKDVPFRRELP